MSKKELDYYVDLKIDPYNLDENTENQPTIYMQYAELASDKRDEVNNQKKVIKVKDAELKEVTAKLFVKYKNEFIDSKKPTDSMANNLVLIDEEYKKKFNETIKELEKYNKLSHQLDILEAAVTSFQQRKNMIEERIKLHQSGYNSEVKQKNYNSKIHTKLNKKGE